MLTAFFERRRRLRAFEAQRRISNASLRDQSANELAAGMGGTVVCRDTELDERGIRFLPPLLTKTQVDEVHRHLSNKLAHDPYRRCGRFVAPAAIPPQTHVAHYRLSDIVACPHLLEAANDPAVLELVEGHLGAPPLVSALRLWWSVPSGPAEHAELFHRDVDDLRFLKLFVYLSDVSANTGPHVYVPGSHRAERLTQLRRYDEIEVADAFPEGTMCITGAAGTSFLANTYAIHRGLPPVRGARLAFQVLYSLRPLVYSPLSPVGRAARPCHALRLFLRQP